MGDNILIWSCNRKKFMKVISSEETYTERLGCKLNSIWYVKIRVYREYDWNDTSFTPERSYYTKWEFQLKREHGLVTKTVNAKLVLNTKILVDKDLHFGHDCESSDSFLCDTTKLSGYHLDLVIRFPETKTTEAVIEEQFKISELNNLSDDFRSLLDKELMADVILKCDSLVLKVHKIVLCSRSSVFDAMFHSHMQETKEDIVVISDMEPSVLQDMIEFVYTGQVKATSVPMIYNLLYAAEKYQIKALKTSCVKHLRSLLSHDNAIKILEISDLFDKQLKLDAVCFLKDNLEELKHTKEWIDLKLKNPVLALEVYSNND